MAEHDCSGCGGDNKHIDVLHGPYNTYDPKTDVFTEGEFIDGMPHGAYTEYYGMEKSMVKKRGSYNEGLKQGEWAEFDRSGNAVVVKVYNKGKLIEQR